jgi:hypothetical protein
MDDVIRHEEEGLVPALGDFLVIDEGGPALPVDRDFLGIGKIGEAAGIGDGGGGPPPDVLRKASALFIWN